MLAHNHLRGDTQPHSIFLAVCAAIALSCCSALAQHAPGKPDPLTFSTPQQWVAAATANELPMIQYDVPYLRFHMLYEGDKGLELRDEIESREGMVARVIAKNGRALTPEEDAAERDRLQHLLDNPSDFYSHHKHDQADKNRAASLVKLLPQAMLFTYADDQTPAPNDSHPQVVIDYKPNPAFKPPNIEAEALQGLTGRIWIDRNSAHMVRMHADITNDVSFGWGLLARIYHGGSLQLDQTDAGPRWMFQHLDEHLSVRALMVKTINVNVKLQEGNYSPITAMSYQDAIRTLLSTPAPTHCPCN
jgi:hypothetical protein